MSSFASPAVSARKSWAGILPFVSTEPWRAGTMITFCKPDACCEVAHDLGAVVMLAAIAIAIDRDENFRLDLLEAIPSREFARIRRTERPHRTDADRRQKRDDRLRDVRHVGCDL